MFQQSSKPPRAFITTSWDDGHILDFRLADLLERYGLDGTFYIPRQASTRVMDESAIRSLSQRFEIGGHTMNHVFLDTAPHDVARREISECKTWIEQLTGKPCPMFCPPGGKFFANHLQMIESAGFQASRSVELLSVSRPRRQGKLLLLPTTLQAHPHRAPAYLRNILKRRSLGNLWLYVLQGREGNWDQMAESIAKRVLSHGGVFHLWGHSWELEQNAQWQRLESVFKFLSGVRQQLPCVSNGELCRQLPGHSAKSAALRRS